MELWWLPTLLVTSPFLVSSPSALPSLVPTHLFPLQIFESSAHSSHLGWDLGIWAGKRHEEPSGRDLSGGDGSVVYLDGGADYPGMYAYSLSYTLKMGVFYYL
jgi:hypothetical protein